jgi:DNA adenine methylase
MRHVRTRSEALPFLKWAGGKRQLLPALRGLFPPEMARYREPFLGSGAVFFDVHSTGKVASARAALSDDNADLIGTYLRVRDAIEPLLVELRRLARQHERSGREHYYRVRDRLFNQQRTAWLRSGGDAMSYSVELAALMIYLNRTGYNGLFRLNRAGRFNVPAGRYSHPEIVNEERLRRAASALAGAEIFQAPFEAALGPAARGDVVYLDPPYAPVSATSSFRSYTQRDFDDHHQSRLRDEVVRLAQLGAVVVLSNSVAPSVLALYGDAAVRRAGLRCFRVAARRAINSRATNRGPVEELVVTNARTLTVVA